MDAAQHPDRWGPASKARAASQSVVPFQPIQGRASRAEMHWRRLLARLEGRRTPVERRPPSANTLLPSPVPMAGRLGWHARPRAAVVRRILPTVWLLQTVSSSGSSTMPGSMRQDSPTDGPSSRRSKPCCERGFSTTTKRRQVPAYVTTDLNEKMDVLDSWRANEGNVSQTPRFRAGAHRNRGTSWQSPVPPPPG